MEYANEVFEKENASIEGLTFCEVYDQKPQFVAFTKIWTEATGRWLLWKKYVHARSKNEQTKHTTSKLENIAKI